MMLLKALLIPLSLFLGGVGTLRLSVWYENYILLAGGVLLSVVGLALAFPDRTRRMRDAVRLRRAVDVDA